MVGWRWKDARVRVSSGLLGGTGGWRLRRSSPPIVEAEQHVRCSIADDLPSALEVTQERGKEEEKGQKL